MQKIDHKKEFKELYRASAQKVEQVAVPKLNYLMVDGQGDPQTTEAFKDAVEALYPLAFALKFMVKKSQAEVDYTVMPLEGLWWADDMDAYRLGRKDEWKWTLMVMQPSFVTAKLVKQAIEQVKAKKDPVALELVRFESLNEGKAAQTMHIGPYDQMASSVERMHEFIADCGGKHCGKHHDIYLSDPRRTAPEKLKTIVRQPFRV